MRSLGHFQMIEILNVEDTSFEITMI